MCGWPANNHHGVPRSSCSPWCVVGGPFRGCAAPRSLGRVLFWFFSVVCVCVWDVATRGLWCTLQKHNGRLTDARPQDPRQTTDNPGGPRSPLRRPQSMPADADSFCVFTVRKKTASFVRWIRCGVWGSLSPGTDGAACRSSAKGSTPCVLTLII